MKLYAIIKNEEGKEVKIGSNERIECTLYERNKKQYSVFIEWTDIGDIIDNDGNELPESEKTKGSIITTRDWRNQPDKLRIMPKSQKQKGKNTFCTECGYIEAQVPGRCKKCGQELTGRI